MRCSIRVSGAVSAGCRCDATWPSGAHRSGHHGAALRRLDGQRARVPLEEDDWGRAPTIVLVVGDLIYTQPISDPMRVTGAPSRTTSLAGHRKSADSRFDDAV